MVLKWQTGHLYLGTLLLPSCFSFDSFFVCSFSSSSLPHSASLSVLMPSGSGCLSGRHSWPQRTAETSATARTSQNQQTWSQQVPTSVSAFSLCPDHPSGRTFYCGLCFNESVNDSPFLQVKQHQNTPSVRKCLGETRSDQTLLKLRELN